MQPNDQHCGVQDLQAVLVVEPAMDYYRLLKVLGSVLIHTTINIMSPASTAKPSHLFICDAFK